MAAKVRCASRNRTSGGHSDSGPAEERRERRYASNAIRRDSTNSGEVELCAGRRAAQWGQTGVKASTHPRRRLGGRRGPFTSNGGSASSAARASKSEYLHGRRTHT